MARIEDGTGSGVFAAVTADNKIAVQAESIPSLAVASASREDFGCLLKERRPELCWDPQLPSEWPW